MDNCWISCQVVADMKKVYNDLIIIDLYLYKNWKKDCDVKIGQENEKVLNGGPQWRGMFLPEATSNLNSRVLE